MTPPVVPAPPKVPFWVHLVAVPVGFTISVPGGWFLYLEMKAPPTHLSHIAIFSAIMLLGMLTSFSYFVLPILQWALAAARATNLPYIGRGPGSTPP